MTTMYLLRHGATAANLENPARLQGRCDPPLVELGLQQARATAEALAHVNFAAAYSSPLTRAMETAKIVAQALPIQPVAELTECHVGRWEGIDWGTIQTTDAVAFANYMADPSRHGYPGGESFTDVLARTTPALQRIFATHVGETFLVVSHHVVIRTYVATTLGLPLKKARGVSLDNCGISIVTHDGTNARVQTVNSTIHLRTDKLSA